MGIYEGQRENPCPRCGGVVGTTFISVTPMSFSQRCHGCGTTDFMDEENAQLGGNRYPDIEDQIARQIEKPN